MSFPMYYICIGIIVESKFYSSALFIIGILFQLLSLSFAIFANRKRSQFFFNIKIIKLQRDSVKIK